MSNTKHPGSDYQELFDHLLSEHNLLLVESEMSDIIHIVNKMNVSKSENKISRFEFITKNGREIVEYGEFTFQLQDNNKTLKVFRENIKKN